jgi:hypothetical protein
MFRTERKGKTGDGARYFVFLINSLPVQYENRAPFPVFLGLIKAFIVFRGYSVLGQSYSLENIRNLLKCRDKDTAYRCTVSFSRCLMEQQRQRFLFFDCFG